MVETVGFFETAVELEQLLAWSKPQSERLALIALTPEADAAAELRAVPYRTIEDCYDETDLLAQGMAQYRLAERLCVAIDRHLEAAGGAEWPRHGVSFRHLYKHVKTILDALLHRTLTLKRALIAQAAQRVVHVLDPADTRPANPAALPRSLCALLLPHVARQLGCQVVSLPAASHRHVQDRPRGFAAARAVRPLIRRLVSHVDALRRLVERRRVSASVWRPSGVNDALNGGGSGPTTVVLTSLWSDRDVLTAWQGLGYNRRALYLKRAAEVVMNEYKGKLPSDPATLVKLPGIGAYTAGAVCAFAFNEPVVFIDTNVRRVFIYHFFIDREGVSDVELVPLVEATLDKENAREWYSALMDYGSMLGAEEENANKRSAHYVKQSKFEGSLRQVRGKIVKYVTSSMRQVTRKKLQKALGETGGRIDLAIAGLQKDGIISVSRRRIFLAE